MIEYRNTPNGLTPKGPDGSFVGSPIRPSANKHLAALRGS